LNGKDIKKGTGEVKEKKDIGRKALLKRKNDPDRAEISLEGTVSKD
jgi:hypothetical protein